MMNQEDFFFNLIVDPVLESQAIQVEVEPGLVFVFDSHLLFGEESFWMCVVGD